MEQLSGFLIRVAAGAICVLTLAPIAANAQMNPSEPPASPQVPLQPGTSNTMLARMSLRITQLENEIRRLTGQNEELIHRVGELELQLEKSKSDTELRLKALESGTPRAGPPGMAAAGASGNVVPSRPNSSQTAVATNEVSGAHKGARVLGTIRSGPMTSGSSIARAVEPPKAAMTETPEQLYDRAHSLIVKHRKYGEAERVLRQFIDANPKHPLASNAHYWLGRTYFVRADYENAAFAFAEGFQKFPEAEKAPANLLNLGMSLARLGKNREACTTYTRLTRTYKDADGSIQRRIARERQRANCRSR